MSTQRLARRAVAVAALATVSVSVLVATAAPVSARTPRQRAGTDASTTAGDPSRTIVATGTARVRGTPDVLTVMLGVTTRGKTVGEALDHNNAAARRVIDVLLDGGVDKKDVQTTNFSIGPFYGDDGNDVEGYQVSNLVVAQLRDLGKAGSLLDKAAQAGGDDVIVRGVNFDIDNTSDLVAAARADAVKRARSQAEQLATAAGVQLGDVLTISESSQDVGPVVSMERAAGDAAASSVPIQSGSEELTVQVSVVFSDPLTLNNGAARPRYVPPMPGHVVAPDGTEWVVGRRWLPRPPRWVGAAFPPRWRRRDDNAVPTADMLDPTDPTYDASLAGGVLIVALAVAVAVAFVAFVVPALVFALDLLFVLVLAGLAVLARVVFHRPWIVVARSDAGRYEWAVVGWKASGAAIEIVQRTISRGESLDDVRLRLL